MTNNLLLFTNLLFLIIEQDERKAIEELVVQMGGVYSPDLTKTCTHLIAKTNQGRKFEFAAKWGLHIVTMDWVHASLELGGKRRK